jgi:5-methylcytosine-specific restriction protein A
MSARLCSRPGCTQLMRHTHRAYTEDRRESAAKRGYDRHHLRWRQMVLARSPYCTACEARGRVTVATEADHIRALRQGGDWSLENGQGLCKPCHSKKTRSEYA